MHYTTFVSREDFCKNIKEFNREIKEILKDNSNILTEDLYSLPITSYHFVAKLLGHVPENPEHKVLHSLLANTAKQGEILSAGSGYISLLFATILLDYYSKQQDLLATSNETELLQQYEKTFNLFREELKLLTTPPTPQDIKNSIKDICVNSVLEEVVWEAVSLAGLEGTISVEDSKQPSWLVELREGYNFPAKPYKFFLGNGTWEANNVKMLLIDGFIESIAEIDQVLMKNIETGDRQPIVIVAQGFSEEVVATLKVNQDKKRLNVLPVRLEQSLENLNVLNDIAVVCGSEIITSLKGDLISMTKYEDLATVNKVRCNFKELTIEHHKTRAAVSAQIRGLLEKRKDNIYVLDVADLIDKRIKSLLKSSVVIRLPNMSSLQRDENKTKIDVSLRTCKTVLNYGMVDIDKLSRKVSVPTVLELLKKLGNIRTVPTMSLYTGLYLVGKSILSLMCGSGVVVINPNHEQDDQNTH